MSTERPDHGIKLRDVPHKPGVYVMRDRFKKVIYVGKARDLRKRLANYFTPSRASKAEMKTRALIDSIWDYEWHIVKSDAEAVLFEGKLIKEFRPKYNISFRDDKRFLLVRVNLADPFPRFQLARLRKEDGARYFGPFAHAGALRSTLNAIRKKFGIRGCTPMVPGERDFKHCHDHLIKNCSAPCVLKVTREEYMTRVMQACEFLDGQSRQMTEQVEEEMKAAAAKMDFEKAAQLRNLLDDLRRTTKPMQRFTRKSLPTSTIDPLADVAALAEALQLGKPPRVMECFDISNISNTHIVASMVRFKDGVPDRSNYRRYRIRTTNGQNDFASMAEVVRRRYSRVLRESAPILEDAEYSQLSPAEMMERAQRASAASVDPLPEEVREGDSNPPSTGPNPSANSIEPQPARRRYVLADSPSTYSAPAPIEDIDLRSEATDDSALSPEDMVEQSDSESAPAEIKSVTLPDLIIVDGGKGQLSSACKELQRLGLYDVPIIGLAKEFEEIYRPGRPLPLILKEGTGALMLLQRIRDEAHRFANGFHSLLLKRRMHESILDDIPGVSENRKRALLAAFGSVQRLKKTPVEKIAAVSGIGPKLGEAIVEYLARS